MLLREIKNIFHKELDPLYPKKEVDSFFYLLIEDLLGLERFVLAIQPKLTISKEEETSIFKALSRLKLNEPIQYVMGRTHFMGMEFVVNKDVLIPRPETEELVCWMLNEIASKKCEKEEKKLRILDIGTGSGCIAISLAKNLPKAKIFALDISKKALTVAKENATINEVEIVFLNEDVFEFEFEQEFDIIVSNPPYVQELEKAKMHKNVLEFEPEQALFVSDERPLLFFEKISDFARNNLREGGMLFFEINQYLSEETEQLLHDRNFSETEVRKDLFGNTRMLKGELIS